MIVNELEEQGYQIIKDVYSKEEIARIKDQLDIDEVGNSFGVRELFMKSPELKRLVFKDELRNLTRVSSKTKAVRSLYFDKPPRQNWIVNWHQDLTINVDRRAEIEGYKNWRVQEDRVTVQPPVDCLNRMITARIHLDDCDLTNGALRVVPRSHCEGVIDVKKLNFEELNLQEEICELKVGDVLLMKPLILHRSKRSSNEKRRRVIHVEFSDWELPSIIRWKEL